MAWTRYIPVTVDHTKVSGGADLTNFTFPIDITNAELKTVANSGLVTDAQGDDIAVFSDAACTTMLKFQRIFYSATTGQWVAWVKAPTMPFASDLVVYVGYANASVTTDQSDKANAWDASTVAFYNGGDGTTLDLNDHTGSFALTNVGTATAVAGLIGGAVSLNGTTQYLERTASTPVSAMPLTIENLFKPSASVTANQIVTGLNPTASSSVGYETMARATDSVRAQCGTGTAPQTSNGVLNSTNWHYAASVFTSATARRLLVDGAAAVTDTASFTPANAPTNVTIGVRATNSTHSGFFAGLVNIAIVSNATRSDGWCTTRDAATRGIATFSSAGSPAAVGGGSTPRAALLMGIGLL